MTSFWLPRRTFLQGLGVSLLLPPLEAMMGSSAEAATLLPPRFIAVHLSLGSFGKGYDLTKNDASRYPNVGSWEREKGGQGAWYPRDAGPFAAPLPPALANFESLKQKVLLVSGLGTLPKDPIHNGTTHSSQATLFLTSAWKSTPEGPATSSYTPSDSIDQYIANGKGFTPGSTLVLNPEGPGDFGEHPGEHAGAISFNSKLAAGGSSVLPRTASAVAAFNRIFGNCVSAPTDETRRQKSLLDYVQASATQLQKKLGAQDRARLDSYQQNIRDLELKLTQVQVCPTLPSLSSPYAGTTMDKIVNLNLMVDVIALAVASGAMPIASLMTNVEASDGGWASTGVDQLSTFVGLDGNRVKYTSASVDTHFDLTHAQYQGSTPVVANIEMHIAYTQMKMGFVARLANKLDSMAADINGLTPLDNTVILAGSAHANPGDHDTHNIPLLLAGGKGLRMKQGQHLAAPTNTDVAELYYSIAKQMGVNSGPFAGCSTGIPGVFA